MSRRKGVMLAYPFSEARLNKWLRNGLSVLVQPKINGVRCRSVPTTLGHALLSSEENPIVSVPHINKALDYLRLNKEFDGELDINGAPLSHITSITSRTINIHPLHEVVKYYIFDIINSQSQIERLVQLRALRREKIIPHVYFVETKVASDLAEVMRCFDDFVAQGYEGIILRHPAARYIPKKTTTMMKLKPRKEGIYLIVNQHEEYSIYDEPKNRLGAFVCQTGEGQTFKVGTGLTAKQREHYWEQPLEGKMLRIKYQELTPRGVPFSPVFVEVLK